MRFSAEFKRGFAVRLETRFRLLEPIIGGRLSGWSRVLLPPTSAIDYANIASNYRDMDKKENAIRYYEMALELDSSIDFAQQNLKMLKDAT